MLVVRAARRALAPGRVRALGMARVPRSDKERTPADSIADLQVRNGKKEEEEDEEEEKKRKKENEAKWRPVGCGAAETSRAGRTVRAKHVATK